MQKLVRSKVSDENKIKIINHWLYNKNNSVPQIALLYDLSHHLVHKIIDNYLKSKIRS